MIHCMFKVQILNLPIHGIHFHVFFFLLMLFEKFTLFLKTSNWLELERARTCGGGGGGEGVFNFHFKWESGLQVCL